MRPETTHADEELYECFDCGERFESPTGRECDACGGTLRNITRPRDL